MVYESHFELKNSQCKQFTDQRGEVLKPSFSIEAVLQSPLTSKNAYKENIIKKSFLEFQRVIKYQFLAVCTVYTLAGWWFILTVKLGGVRWLISKSTFTFPEKNNNKITLVRKVEGVLKSGATQTILGICNHGLVGLRRIQGKEITEGSKQHKARQKTDHQI